MDKYLQIAKSVASTLSAIPFFKYGLWLVMVSGVSAFLYFGFKGVTMRNTILLFPFREQLGTIFTPSELQRFVGPIEGREAVVFGVIYLVFGLGILVILAPVCYFMAFPPRQ